MPQPDDFESSRRHTAQRAWEDANAWLLRIHSGMMSEQEQRDFSAWRTRHPEHESQFRQAQHFWQALNGLADRVSRDSPPAANPSRHESLPRPGSTPLQLGHRRRPWGMALAATLLLATLGFSLWPSVEFWLADYRTRAGEHRSVSLADGSVVHLNTRSALSVSLSQNRRSLALKQGEALFEVAHDPARPFEVTVGGVVVQAIGTVFNIDRHGRDTVVSVLEGTVRVLRRDHTIDVHAGSRITLADGGRIAYPEPVNLPGVTAWRRHELVFDQMPLQAIVTELNRYRTDTVLIVDARLRAQQLSGSVSLNDPAQSLALLQRAVSFRTIQWMPYLTILTR